MPVAMLSTSLISEPKRYGRFNALNTPQPINPGMVLIKPTSIANSGGSASIGANGQVTFTAVTSLSLNGVFSADFDNYVLSIRSSASTGLNVNMRMRASGTDNSGSNYTLQQLNVTGTSVTSGQATGTSIQVHNSYGTQRSGSTTYIYGPYLAQPTAIRSLDSSDSSSASLFEAAGTHSLSTSYDGFTLIPTSGNITGALQVYGVRS